MPQVETSFGSLTVANGETMAWGTRTYVMGIINLTPDSFSDGGRFVGPSGQIDVDAAVAAGEELVRGGALMIDVPDGKYLELPKWGKRAAILEHDALQLPGIPRALDHLGEEDALVIVVDNVGHFDAALLCDQNELDRIWRHLDAGDDRPMDAFVIKRDRLNVAGRGD